MKNKLGRVGNFTSSEIYRLLGVNKKGEPSASALSYLEEKRYERKLGRGLGGGSESRAMSWGSIMEQYAFEQLGLEYTICSEETIVHPIYHYWAGSPDGYKTENGERIVFDIKCPYTMLSFCRLSECHTPQDLIEKHQDGEKYYWQLVSNAILLNCNRAELIVFCPKEEQLQHIRDWASNYDGNQNKMAWINWAEDDDLPFVPAESQYSSVHIISFEIPESDKAKLIQAVENFGKKLLEK